MFVIEPARVMADVNQKVVPGAQPVYICRLAPPLFMPNKSGTGCEVVQQQTMPYISCWSWKEGGTLPGDVQPASTVKVIA